MSSPTDQELADALIDWADAFPIETSTYQQYWDALKSDNAEFFHRFDADKDSLILGQAYTDAMARADDDGVFRKPLFLPYSAPMRRTATADPAQIDAMLTMLEAEAPAALAGEDEQEREEWLWNQVNLLTYEITAEAWTDELVQRLFELAERLGMTGKELIAYPVRPLQVDPRT